MRNISRVVVTAATAVLMGCGGGGGGGSVTGTDESSPATFSDSDNDTDTSTPAQTTPDEAEPVSDTGSVVDPGALVGRWQLCQPNPDQGIEPDDGVQGLSVEFEFAADGRVVIYDGRYLSPECDGELLEEDNELLEGTMYMVEGTATTSEGLSVLEVIFTNPQNEERALGFYNINGDTLLVAAESESDGLVTQLDIPFTRQSDFSVLSDP